MNNLQTAVLEQLGFDSLDDDAKDTLSDISNHGVDGGFNGFIYYSDTVEFFDNNRNLVLSELNQFADELGESAIDIVKGFKCLNGDYDSEVEQVIMNLDDSDNTTVKNALAWFAAEHVAHQLAQ